MRRVLFITIPTILFALAGYAYYHYIGCSNGTCTIASSPFLSTAFGALIGASVGFTISDRKDKDAHL